MIIISNLSLEKKKLMEGSSCSNVSTTSPLQQKLPEVVVGEFVKKGDVVSNLHQTKIEVQLHFQAFQELLLMIVEC